MSLFRKSRRWRGGLVLVAIAFAGCSTSAQPAQPASTPAPAAKPKSSFGQSLSLAMTLPDALVARAPSMTAKFALTNKGSATFEGCFGPSWGVSVIAGGHDAGNIVRAEHPTCVEKLTLLPNQTIVWSKTVPLSNPHAGTAKVTGWVKVVDPATCNARYGCHEVSIATPVMTVAIAEK